MGPFPGRLGDMIQFASSHITSDIASKHRYLFCVLKWKLLGQTLVEKHGIQMILKGGQKADQVPRCVLLEVDAEEREEYTVEKMCEVGGSVCQGIFIY